MICSTCKSNLPSNSFYKRGYDGVRGRASQCKTCRKLSYNKHRKANMGLYAKKRRDWLVRLRQQMIIAYGGSCNCCGETEPIFLQLDHIYDDGYKDRVRGLQTAALLAYLRRLNWPQDRHQLLCANCNMAKELVGICPHKAK